MSHALLYPVEILRWREDSERVYQKDGRSFSAGWANPRLASPADRLSLSLSLFIRRSVSLFSVSLLLRVVLSSPRVLSFIMMRCSLRRLYIFALR